MRAPGPVSASSLSHDGAQPAPRAGTNARDDIPLGIACMIGATLMFAASSAIMKIEVAKYPVGEVMCARSLGSLIACAAVVLPAMGLRVFATPRPGAPLARGLSQSISQTFTSIALWVMP